MVPLTGLEPVRCHQRGILSPLCLPIPSQRHNAVFARHYSRHIISTTVVTLDNKVVHLPNGALSSGNIVNYSEKDTRRVDQVFHISYESDANKAIEILKALAERNGAVLKDPAPFVKISGALDSSIEITTRLWVKAADYWDVYFYMLENAKPAFDAAGISIPYPQVDVHMKN